MKKTAIFIIATIFSASANADAFFEKSGSTNYSCDYYERAYKAGSAKKAPLRLMTKECASYYTAESMDSIKAELKSIEDAEKAEIKAQNDAQDEYEAKYPEKWKLAQSGYQKMFSGKAFTDAEEESMAHYTNFMNGK